MLDLDETNALVARWQSSRDERARDKLTSSHWPLIRAYGSRLARRHGFDVDDATQEAALGFLRALDTFDPSLSSLASYAHRWANQRVQRLSDLEGPIHVPVHVRDRNRTMRRAFTKLRRILGRAPTPAEIAAEIGWTEERVFGVSEAMRVAGELTSLSKPVGEEEDGELGDLVEADEDTRPDVRVLGKHEAGQARTAILQAAELLPERWRRVLAARLVEGLTLDEAGELLGVTRERVRQIETKVLARMREALRYDPRALNLLGLEVDVPIEVTRADADGLGIRDIIAMTGWSADQVDHAVDAGSFPRHVATSHHRGARVWDPAAVEGWMAERDAASASAAAKAPSPGIGTPETAEAAPAPASGPPVGTEVPAGASAPPALREAPRSYAPRFANALMGGCSVLAVFVAA